jgi:hypothetical protein
MVVVPRTCGRSEVPERVFTRERVKVEGSEEEGTQVIFRGAVKSMVEPGTGDVKVRAEVEVVRKRRRGVEVRILGVGGSSVSCCRRWVCVSLRFGGSFRACKERSVYEAVERVTSTTETKKQLMSYGSAAGVKKAKNASEQLPCRRILELQRSQELEMKRKEITRPQL